MTCPSGSLLDYVHGFLGEAEKVEVEKHLLGCPACRQALGRMQEEERIFREAAVLTARLPEQLTMEREERFSGLAGARDRRGSHSGRVIAMAAALLLCAGVSWMLLHSPSSGPEGGPAQARQEIEKLGSESQAEREAAYLKLKDMGKAAEPELRKAISSTDPEVARRAKRLLSRLALLDELPAGLRKAVPGIEDRLAGSADHAWTQEFLNASELTPLGLHVNSALRKEDVSVLVTRALRGAQDSEEKKITVDQITNWGLRLTQYLPGDEALRCLHGSIDVENMSLPDLLAQILTKNGVSFLVDAAALQERVSMKTFDISVESNLILLLHPRRRAFATLDGLVVITEAGKPWKANARDAVPPTPEETAKVDRLLKDLVSSDKAKEGQAYEDLVTLGPPVLGPVMGALGRLDVKGAARARAVCRKIAWDHNNLWLVDLPSGADLQNLSAAGKKLLESRMDCEVMGMSLEDLLKAKGWKVQLKAKPQETLCVSLKGETLGSFLKAVTRPRGLDFYLDGETIVIDTQDNVSAAVDR